MTQTDQCGAWQDGLYGEICFVFVTTLMVGNFLSCVKEGILQRVMVVACIVSLFYIFSTYIFLEGTQAVYVFCVSPVYESAFVCEFSPVTLSLSLVTAIIFILCVFKEVTWTYKENTCCEYVTYLSLNSLLF